MLEVKLSRANHLIKNYLIKVYNWVIDNVVIKSSKAGIITGSIFTAVLMVATVAFNSCFIELEYTSRWLLLASAFILPIITGLSIAYTLTIKSDIANKIFHIILLFLLPILAITMTEAFNCIFIYDMTYLGFFGNYMIVLLMYFLIFAITGSIRVCMLTVNSILFGFSFAHAYVVYFRGTPFLPMDFSGITTGLNVASTYTLKPIYNVILGTYLFVILTVIAIKIKMPKYHKLFKITFRSFAGAFFAVLMYLFYFTPIFANAGVKPDFWNQTRGYKNYGFAFSFFCNTKYLYMTTPEGYVAGEVGNYVSENVNNDEPAVRPSKSAPNIICIMNESLADMKLLGEFTTNEDYMPFMRSLTENTIKGNLYVPVIGAGTSNTEFEFLTGNSVAFLPSGSNAYMLYIKSPMASLVSTLEAQGYSSLALHPYYASGWKRTSVYNFLGFNRFFSLENIIDQSILNDYANNGGNADYLQSLIEQYYPEKSNMLIRQYVSDSYDYKLIIDDFENRDKSVPYFVFNVTMQNHGGYTTSASNFDECISITSADKYYTKASKYLSLVKASDNAFAELIEYFKKIKEPTIICMFGDHQPSIETEFISSIMGVKDLTNLTIEQEQLRHATQFYIWANYKIEEQYIDKLSSNYLSSLLVKTAGLKQTEYSKYLLKLSETLPVIDTVGYIDNNNNYYRWNDETEYTSSLEKYEKIQYNNVFDQQNKKTEMFYIDNFRIDDISGEEE